MADPTPPAPALGWNISIPLAWLNPINWVKALNPSGMDLVLAALVLFMNFRGCVPIPTPNPPTPPVPVAVISIPAAASGDVGRMIYISATTQDPKAKVQWWCDDSQDLAILSDTHNVVFSSAKAGTFTVLAATSDNGSVSPFVACKVAVGTPVPPVPPTPPAPPSPIPSDGFRVLIVYPSDPSWKPTSGQLGAMYGADVQTYLHSKCVKGTDGKSPEFRILPENIDMSKESKLWQDFVKLPHASSPWVFIANGDKGTSQALPADQAAMLKLLISIGG